jgi:gamma-glutamyl:cysteine ligase YbdK (ATP-grasp superfamily)
VHIGIEDPEFRIDCLNAARYVLPHILCLSTSSPFWAAAKRDCTRTGASSSRISAQRSAAGVLQ